MTNTTTPTESLREWATRQHAPKRTPKTVRIAVECLECGRKFTVSARSSDPECPRCHGVDIDVRVPA